MLSTLPTQVVYYVGLLASFSKSVSFSAQKTYQGTYHKNHNSTTLMMPPEHSKGCLPGGGPPLRSNSGLPSLDLTTTAQEILQSARRRNGVPQPAAANDGNQSGDPNTTTTTTSGRQTRLLDVLQAASQILSEESETEMSRWSHLLEDDAQQEDDNNRENADDDGGGGHSTCNTGDEPSNELP